jgi:hypothetical protein
VFRRLNITLLAREVTLALKYDIPFLLANGRDGIIVQSSLPELRRPNVLISTKSEIGFSNAI